MKSFKHLKIMLKTLPTNTPATGAPCEPKELLPVDEAASPSPSVPWDPKELLSISQVAKFVGVAEITVRRWVKLEQIRSRRAGKQIRIDKADLLKFLDQQ